MRFPTLLIEDHPLMRETLSQFVREMTDVDLIGAVGSGPEALQFCHENQTALALIDVSLPEMSGIELVRELRSRYPDLICLMLSGHQEITYIRRALANGAQGYVLKGDPEELLRAIASVTAGETYLSEPIRDKLAAAGQER
jgi:DNA-binding NarL/FixJ family response regulator